MVWVNTIQYVIIALLILAITLLQYFFRPQVLSIFTIVALVLLLLVTFFLPDEITGTANQRIIIKTVLISFFVNLYLNLAFYPSLLKYQAGSEAAFWLNAHNPKNLPVVMQNGDFTSEFEFYNKVPVIFINADDKRKLPASPFLFYGDTTAIHSLTNQGLHPELLAEFERYRITRLKPAFLNKYTRASQMNKIAVVLFR